MNVERVPAGTVLARQGDVSWTFCAVLDGYVWLQENRRRLAEFGPGAMFAECATLERAARTTSLVATTKCRLARVPGETLDEEVLGSPRVGPSSSGAIHIVSESLAEMRRDSISSTGRRRRARPASWYHYHPFS